MYILVHTWIVYNIYDCLNGILKTPKCMFIRVYLNDYYYSSPAQQTLELLLHDIFLGDPKVNKAASEVFNDIILNF